MGDQPLRLRARAERRLGRLLQMLLVTHFVLTAVHGGQEEGHDQRGRAHPRKDASVWPHRAHPLISSLCATRLTYSTPPSAYSRSVMLCSLA